MTEQRMCHIHAAWTLSKEVAREMQCKIIKSKDYARIKEILRKYVEPEDGDMFRIRRASQNDWHLVGATRDWYIDDTYAFTVLDFE